MITLTKPYRNSFLIALGLHASLAVFLMVDSSSPRPVLVQESRNEPGQSMPEATQSVIKAVAVDQNEVMKTVQALQKERKRAADLAARQQQQLQQQAEQARQQRIAEQKHLQKLKQEAQAMAIAQQKRLEEEKEHLKKLAEQKKEEAKQLALMKQQQEKLQKQQVQEQQRLAELKHKKTEELALAEAIKAKAELAKKQAAARQLAADNAEKQAKLAGEVNKYKALIVNSIGRQWILPENVNRQLSSQFKIRLAPNGAVLEVSLIRSSGDPILDRSAQSAIYKASPLPVPTDMVTFNLFREISLTVRPESARG